MSCEENNCSILGYYADGFKGRGTFYLATANESPYCGDQYLFEMKLNKDTIKTAGEIYLDLDHGTNESLSVKVTSYEHFICILSLKSVLSSVLKIFYLELMTLWCPIHT